MDFNALNVKKLIYEVKLIKYPIGNNQYETKGEYRKADGAHTGIITELVEFTP